VAIYLSIHHEQNVHSNLLSSRAFALSFLNFKAAFVASGEYRKLIKMRGIRRRRTPPPNCSHLVAREEWWRTETDGRPTLNIAGIASPIVTHGMRRTSSLPSLQIIREISLQAASRA
jgi:hypothetical protein